MTRLLLSSLLALLVAGCATTDPKPEADVPPAPPSAEEGEEKLCDQCFQMCHAISQTQIACRAECRKTKCQIPDDAWEEEGKAKGSTEGASTKTPAGIRMPPMFEVEEDLDL